MENARNRTRHTRTEWTGYAVHTHFTGGRTARTRRTPLCAGWLAGCCLLQLTLALAHARTRSHAHTCTHRKHRRNVAKMTDDGAHTAYGCSLSLSLRLLSVLPSHTANARTACDASLSAALLREPGAFVYVRQVLVHRTDSRWRRTKFLLLRSSSIVNMDI